LFLFLFNVFLLEDEHAHLPFISLKLRLWRENAVVLTDLTHLFGSGTLVPLINFDSNDNQILAFGGTKVPLPINVCNIRF